MKHTVRNTWNHQLNRVFVLGYSTFMHIHYRIYNIPCLVVFKSSIFWNHQPNKSLMRGWRLSFTLSGGGAISKPLGRAKATTSTRQIATPAVSNCVFSRSQVKFGFCGRSGLNWKWGHSRQWWGLLYNQLKNLKIGTVSNHWQLILNECMVIHWYMMIYDLSNDDQDAYQPRLGYIANLAFFNDAGVLLHSPRHHVPHSALYGLLLKLAAAIFYHAFRRLLTYSSARYLSLSLPIQKCSRPSNLEFPTLINVNPLGSCQIGHKLNEFKTF